MSSFPGYRNTYGEEVTDTPRTKFGSLSNDDFFFRNGWEFTTKMKLKDGSFKLKNGLNGKQKGDSVQYNLSTDATLEYTCDYTQTSMRAKFKPRNLEYHLEFPRFNFWRGNVNPYFRLGCSTSLNDFVPAIGWVYTDSQIKIHDRITKIAEKVNLEESAVYVNGPWTVAANVGLALNKLRLNYWSTLLTWQDKDSEVAVSTGNREGGKRPVPEYVNLSLWLRRNVYDLGVQVSENLEDSSERTIRGVYRHNLSKDFWFKTSIDNKMNHDAYTYLNWNGVAVGISAQVNLKNSDDFTGYLDYPFNWGVALQFNA